MILVFRLRVWERVMFRVAAAGLTALVLAGCSVGTGAISTGFTDNSDATAALPSSYSSGPSFGLAQDPAPARRGPSSQVHLAKLDDKAPSDKAPKGTFERAPRGALADRDYSSTVLDAENARDLINKYRSSKGLKPVRLNAELTSAAKAHSRDLARWDRISHFGSDGSNPWDRVKRAGYKAKVAAENVGTGQVTFAEVLKGWKDSPGHNKNLLLADANHMGIALVQDPKSEFKSFWTLVLGSSM